MSHGLTSVHDAGFDPKSLEFFKKLVVAVIYHLAVFDHDFQSCSGRKIISMSIT